MVRIFGTEKKEESQPVRAPEAVSVPEPPKADKREVIIEREIDLSLINEKLNYVISLLQEATKD